MTNEHKRLQIIGQNERSSALWGPYLSERQWGTVREDYSADGNAWTYFPFEHSHFRTYRWGEDGLAGISDAMQNLCFSVALWNGKDPVLKERLYGLTNRQGNHGEDVKELYYYLDNIPSHYYMDYLYKYPQQEFPYDMLKREGKSRSRLETEFELLDTGIFNDGRYFDVQVTYAKESEKDIYIRINITNHSADQARLTVLPTIWFSRQRSPGPARKEPVISYRNKTSVKAKHHQLGKYYFYVQDADDMLFTDNVTNLSKLKGRRSKNIFTKDAFNDAIINGRNLKALRKRKAGSKFSSVHNLVVAAGQTHTIYCRLCDQRMGNGFKKGFEEIFNIRKQEADEFYASVFPTNLTKEIAGIQRQAVAGLLWSKQYYYFDVEHWLDNGDGHTDISAGRKHPRNNEWRHMKNQDIILMPDKWEYPWYAAWDLAFHTVAIASLDPSFAKHQLLLIIHESYMKPDGQMPAYEWNFSDVNPPVHAWAALEVYKAEMKTAGKGDITFLTKIFKRLMVNFNWWMLQKDRKGNQIFEGGFLGLDNIGVVDRSVPGSDLQLEQADATGWMGTFALNMMDIALEISRHDATFEETAASFFEHFVKIATSINQHYLWNEPDKFFYDVLSSPGTEPQPLQVRSIVGLTSLFAVSIVSKKAINKLEFFKQRALALRDLRQTNQQYWPIGVKDERKNILVSLVPPERLLHLLERMLNEDEFLSPGGIRALSKFHQKNPYTVTIKEVEYTISYDPGDSTSNMFGGNSNWRGPVWIPINYLFIQSIRRYGEFYGDELKVEFPTGSGNRMNLSNVADELTKRIISLFRKDEAGKRPFNGVHNWFYERKENVYLVLFYEYFHGDSGQGLGAAHQTGWTALVAELISAHSLYNEEKTEQNAIPGPTEITADTGVIAAD